VCRDVHILKQRLCTNARLPAVSKIEEPKHICTVRYDISRRRCISYDLTIPHHPRSLSTYITSLMESLLTGSEDSQRYVSNAVAHRCNTNVK